MAAAAKAKPVDAGQPMAPMDGDSPLARLSREIADRYPNTMVRRYIVPMVCARDAREIIMREITSRDEVEGAILADALMSASERASMRLSAEADRRECIRLSIVAVGKLSEPEVPTSPVVYTHANHDGTPFADCNDWKARTWTCLQTFYGTLNGVPTEELSEGLVGALTVGAFALPISATRASAASGK